MRNMLQVRLTGLGKLKRNARHPKILVRQQGFGSGLILTGSVSNLSGQTGSGSNLSGQTGQTKPFLHFLRDPRAETGSDPERFENRNRIRELLFNRKGT